MFQHFNIFVFSPRRSRLFVMESKALGVNAGPLKARAWPRGGPPVLKKAFQTDAQAEAPKCARAKRAKSSVIRKNNLSRQVHFPKMPRIHNNIF